jgi:CHAT domain-containing protein/Tfp pilus assembly protein PilF
VDFCREHLPNMKKLPLVFLLLIFFSVSNQAQPKEYELAEKYDRTADSLSQIPNYQQAILYRKRALNIYQNMRPVPYDRVVMEHRSIGIFYRRAGQIRESEYFQRRAVEIAEKKLPADHIETAKACNSYAIYFLARGNYDRALEFLNKSLVINRRKNYPDVADNYNNIGIILENNGEYEEARFHYQQSLTYNLANPEAGFWSLKVADNYINLGTASHQLGEYDHALAYFDTSLVIHDSLLEDNHPFYASLYNNIGAVFNIKGNYRKAFEYFDKSLTCNKLNLGKNHPEVANVYANIGILLLDRGDLNKALLHFQKAYAIRVENFGENHPLVARTCNYLGDCYLLKNEFDHAYEWLLKSIQIYRRLPGGDPSDLAEYLNDLGLYFEKFGNQAEALKLYNEALALLRQRPDRNDPDIANSLSRIGNVHLTAENFGLAQEFFLKSLTINHKIFGYKHPEVAKNFSRLAQACNGDEVCALEYCDSAFAAINFLANIPPEFGEVISPIVLLEILQTKGKLLHQIAAGDTQKLMEADQVFDAGIQLIEYIKTSLEEPGSRQSLLDNYFLLYEDAISLKCELQQKTGKSGYWNEAFTIAERSNATLLLEALQTIDAGQFAGIPDSLTERERELKIDLAFQEKQLFEEELKGAGANPKKLKELRDKIFNLQNRYARLTDFFRKDFPGYFKLKYSPEIISVKKIQRKLLRPNQTMLSYFVGEHQLFAFIISSDHFEVVPIEKEFPLEIWVEEFRNSIYRYNPASKQVDYLNQKYANIGYELYQLIFEPLLPSLKNRELVIIPGGVLGYLPFDALLASPASNYEDFYGHNYLVRDFQFSYANSATLLDEMSGHNSNWKRGGLMAFAPLYTGDSLTIRSDPWRAVLGKLQYNEAEALAIRDLMGGKVFLDSTATEENFRINAPKAGILHLAVHGKANDEHGEYSYLAFYQTLDSIENELIFVKDLYTMRIRAALVVLSACETGIGELQRGEGIVSLARGFSFAGAASIVTTLWSIDDSASAEIMESFYKNLKAGETKDGALRNAKLAYLNRRKNSNASHPLYWAAFVPVGDMEPLDEGMIWWVWVLTGLGLSAIFGRFFIKRKNRFQMESSAS